MIIVELTPTAATIHIQRQDVLPLLEILDAADPARISGYAGWLAGQLAGDLRDKLDT